MVDKFGADHTGRICYEVFRNSSRVCGHCPNDQLLNTSGNSGGVVVWEDYNPITKSWYINYDRAIKWIDGRIVHLQIATDITQLKELQEKQIMAESQLRQAQKMEAIGNLAGGIAHDFNNILTSIIGYTELVLDDVQKDTIVRENLNEVLTAGKRAKDLVWQILTFARQTDEPTKPIRIDKIAHEVLKFIRSSIPTTIELMKIKPGIPIILCTGYSKNISDGTATEIGIKSFIYKPIVMAELAKTVRNVLDEAQ